MAGFKVILGLFLVALYAPLFIGNRAYYLKVANESWQCPWLNSLFDTNYYECTVDIIFNLFMVMSPLFLLLYVANRRWLHFTAKRFLAGCGSLFLVAIALVLTFHYSRPYITSKDFSEMKELQGIHVNYSLPPIPFAYKETDREAHPQPPSMRHWWGTDPLGRDVLARMVFGLRIAFSVGVVAVTIYMVIGVILGALAGYFGGLVDLVILRFIEIMMCFPFLFFILTIAAMIEKRSIYHVMIIIGLTSWPSVARLTRAEFLRQRELDYVQAAISQGIQMWRTVFSHILPNAISPVLVSATFGIASAILYESTLSFLNVGDASVASWGELLNMGRKEPQSWWLIVIPGLAIFIMVALFNLVGDGLRDSLDPKLRE
jgi:peptide/nickel transport system permease protein